MAERSGERGRILQLRDHSQLLLEFRWSAKGELTRMAGA